MELTITTLTQHRLYMAPTKHTINTRMLETFSSSLGSLRCEKYSAPCFYSEKYSAPPLYVGMDVIFFSF